MSEHNMNPKRQLLIETALKLFYKHGVNSIGINEVLKESGVAKRTLYNHFASKEALLLAALEYRHQIFMSWLEKEIQHAKSNSELIHCLFNALQTWFDSKVEQLGEFRGCFFINTAAESATFADEIKRFCLAHKLQVKALIGQYLKTTNNDLLDLICTLKEGAIVQSSLNPAESHYTRTCIQSLLKLTDN